MGTIYRNGTAFIGSGGAGGVELTQAEYDALPTTEKMNGSIYFISDGEASYPSASTMRYDNSTSGLTATSVQAAVDEVNEKVNDNSWDIAELNTGLSALLKIQTVSTGTQSIDRGYISATFNTPSGYTPIGIVQYEGSGTGSFYIQEMRISGSSAQAYVRAISGSASSLSMSFKVLFAKTGYIS